MPPTCDRASAVPVGRVTRCASPPGTSTRSAPASTAWRRGWPVPTSTCSLMQETKAKDEQFPHDRLKALGYEVAHHGTNQWNGVAILSRVGPRRRAGRLRRRPRLGRAAGRRGAVDRGDVQRHPAVVGLRAQRPRARRPAHGLQARLAGAAARAGQRLGRRRHPGGAGRRLEHRAAGRRRLVDGVLPRQEPRLARRARRLQRLPRGRLRRRRAPAHPRPGRLHLLGLPAAAPSPSAAACASTSCSAHRRSRRASRVRRSTARSARAPAPATTPRSSCSSTD